MIGTPLFLSLHRAARLNAVVASLALVLLCLQPAHAVDIEVAVGFGAGALASCYYLPGSWNPVTVYLAGQGSTGEAELQVSVTVGGHTTNYRRQVTLHPGATRDVESFAVNLPNASSPYSRYSEPAPTVTAQLIVDGRSVTSKQVPLPLGLQSNTYNLLALSNDMGGLAYLSHRNLGLVHRGYNPAGDRYGNYGNPPPDPGKVDPSATFAAFSDDPHTLPSMAQAYEPIDAISLGDLSLDALTQEQQNALKGFVRNGGLLLISGGADLPRLRSTFYADLLPASPDSSTTLPSLPVLSTRYKAPMRFAGSIPILRGRLAPGSRVLLRSSATGDPLVLARPYGSGVVVLTAFDYLSPAIAGWRGATMLWRDLLNCRNSAISPRGLLADTWYSEDNEAYKRTVDALDGARAGRIPPLNTVAILVCTYVLFLVPISYFVLKRINRREIAWFTAPVIIVSFTMVSYIMARSIKGGALSVNRFAVLETSANSSEAAALGAMTLYSPARSSYNISFAPGESESDAYRQSAPWEIFAHPNSGSDTTVDLGKSSIMRDFEVRLWDKRSLATPVFADLRGKILATTSYLPNKKEWIAITNGLPYTLHDCCVVGPGGAVDLGDMAPGEKRTVNRRWGRAGPVTGIAGLLRSDSPDLMAASAQDPDSNGATSARIESQAAVDLASEHGQDLEDSSGEYGLQDVAFAGWSSDSLLNVSVDGQQVNGAEANLFYVHLPLPQNAPESIQAPWNPFMRKPVLDLPDTRTLNHLLHGGGG